jgi:lysophospholipase L1-like esterase
LANSWHRFTTEKTGHVAFLGGSITENTTGHTALVPAWLRARFPDTAFTFTNAGISSTCSHTGAFRLERDVLSKGPVDLLFVEFAVNDDQDAGHSREQAVRGMEGIVRHVRRAHPSADIVMIHFVNPGMLDLLARGETPVSVAAHEAVAARHGIPSVHVGTALAREIAAGRKTWDADYGGVHPNPAGYRFVADLVTALLDQAWASPGPAAPHPAADPLDPGSFAGGAFLDPQAAAWMGGWTHGPCGPDLLPQGAIRGRFRDEPILVADEPGAALTVSFEGTDLGMFVLAGPDAGTVESSVDGGPFLARDLFHAHSKGLNYPRTVMLHQGLRPGFHQVTVRVADAKNEASAGHRVAILRFTVNR